MSTKKISQQTIETIFGQITVNDWRNEEADEKTVASIAFLDTFTVNGKEYSDVFMYLDRSNGTWRDARVYEYGHSRKLTDKATAKVSEELLKLPELAEYFDVLDEDERKRLMIDKAERQIIADSWKALQGLTNEEAAGIYLRILEQFEEGKGISQIRFNQ